MEAVSRTSLSGPTAPAAEEELEGVVLASPLAAAAGAEMAAWGEMVWS